MSRRRRDLLGARLRSFVLLQGPVVRRWTLIVLVAGIPLLFLRTGSDPFNVPKLSVLITGVTFVLCLRLVELLQGAPARSLGRLFVPASLFGVAVVVAWVFADYHYWSLLGLFGRFQGLVPYLFVILFGVLIADAFDGERDRLSMALVVAGTIVGGYALIQVVGLDPFKWQLGAASGPAAQAISTLGNPNFTGGFLGIVLPLVVGVWVTDPPRRAFLKRTIPLIAAGWIFARSEGGWAAGVAGLAVLGGFVLAPRVRRARVVGFLLAVGVAALPVAVIVISVLLPQQRLPLTADERGQWWIAATRMGIDSPLVGHGPNAFAIDGVRFRTEEEAREQRFEYSDDPHSVPLSLFSGWGILGVVGFAGTVVWMVQRGGRLGSTDLVGASFLAAGAAYVTQSFVSIDELSLRLVFWTCLGGLALSTPALVASESSAKQTRTTSRARRKRKLQVAGPFRRPFLVVPCVLATAGALAWSAMFVRADALFHEGQLHFEQGDTEAGAAAIRSALAFREDYRYRHLLGFYLGRAATEEGPSAEPLIDQMMSVLAYADHFPDLPALRDRGRLMSEWKPHDPSINSKALDSYLRALALDPLNPLLRAEATEVAIVAKRFDDLERIVTGVSDELRDDFPIFWVGLAESEAAVNELDAALEHYERAIERSGQNPEFMAGYASVAIEARRYRDAVDLLSPLLRSLNDADLWGLAALSYAHLSDEDQARIAIEQALAIDADQSQALEARLILRSD